MARGGTTRETPTTMSLPQARAMMKGFDKRLDAAIKQGIGPIFDERAWRAVNQDEMLASNIYDTRIFKAAKDSRPAPTWHHTVASVIGQTRSGGRNTVVLRGRATFHQKAGDDAKKQNVSFDALWVMERTSPSQQWKLADQMSLEVANLPRRSQRPSAATATASVTDPLRVVAPVIDGFQQGEFDGLATGKPIAHTKKQIRIAQDIDDTYSCYPRSAKPGTTTVRRSSPDVVVLDRRTPTLVVLRLRCDVDHWTRTNKPTLQVPPAQAKVDGLKRLVTHGPEGYSMTVLISVPRKGKPVVLEVSADRVLRRGAPHPLTPRGRPA